MNEPNLNNATLIEKLWHYGHFHNPEMPTGVQESDLEILSVNDDVVKTAIRSYQQFFAEDFQILSQQMHGRAGVFDGEVGPATRYLIHDVQRCAVPDFGVMTGSGSWDVGCHPEYPKDHAFKVAFDKSRMPAFLGEKDDPNSIMEQAWRMCVAAYADIGIAFFRDDRSSRPDSLASFTRGSGWIGLAIVPRDPNCNTSIWAKYDYNYNPSNLKNQWALLFAHEFGHNMGLSHSRGGVMNPSIIRDTFTSTMWRNDPSYPTLKRWFGGQPIDNPDPDPPTDPDDPKDPPIDTPTNLWLKGTVTVMDGNKELGEFILVPKPKV